MDRSEKEPDLRQIGESIKEIVPWFFKNFNPLPSIAYAKLHGWPVNEDGTIETPGMGRVASSDLVEIHELEELYKR